MATADLVTRIRARGVASVDLVTRIRARAAISLTVSAGSGRQLEPGVMVTLTGAASSVPDVWFWEQIDGAQVQLGGAGQARTFKAPSTLEGTTLQFRVTATKSGATAIDTVSYLVYPHTMWRPLAGDIAPMVLTV